MRSFSGVLNNPLNNKTTVIIPLLLPGLEELTEGRRSADDRTYQGEIYRVEGGESLSGGVLYPLSDFMSGTGHF